MRSKLSSQKFIELCSVFIAMTKFVHLRPFFLYWLGGIEQKTSCFLAFLLLPWRSCFAARQCGIIIKRIYRTWLTDCWLTDCWLTDLLTDLLTSNNKKFTHCCRPHHRPSRSHRGREGGTLVLSFAPVVRYSFYSSHFCPIIKSRIQSYYLRQG